MIRKHHLAVATLCLILAGEAAGAEIVISEVLADPHDESKGEFVELYNAGDEPVDLDGWPLGDSKDVNDTIMDFTGPHDIGLAGTVLPPGAYALVVDPDYEGAYNVRVGAEGDPTRLLMLTVKGDRTLGNGLGNSRDLVFIKKDDITIDQFEWTRSAGGNGISWERPRLDLPVDTANLVSSEHPDGSTPGYRNSTSNDPPATPGPDAPGEPDIPDVPLDPGEPEDPAGPNEPGEPVEPNEPMEPDDTDQPVEPVEPSEPVEPQEPGSPTEPMDPATPNEPDEPVEPNEPMEPDDTDQPNEPGEPQEPIEPMEPDDTDQPGEPGEPQEPMEPDDTDQPSEPGEPQVPKEPMEPEDTDGPEGPTEPMAPQDADDSLKNVLINEIMYNPGPNRTEWIELHNSGRAEVDLAGSSLRLDHVDRARLISPDRLVIEGQGYLVITYDADLFRETHPQFDGIAVEAVGGWERLRNSGAKLLLLDAESRTIHEAEYDEDSSPDPGRSVELVNPDFDPQTWGPSADPEGSTPGRRNALYVTQIPDGVSLHVTNNPFSPDGDQFEDICLVTVDLPASHGILHAMVFDVSGRFLKTLIDQTTVASRHVFTWDGTDQHGRRLPVGPYILYVEQMLPTLDMLTASKHLVVIASSH